MRDKEKDFLNYDLSVFDRLYKNLQLHTTGFSNQILKEIKEDLQTLETFYETFRSTERHDNTYVPWGYSSRIFSMRYIVGKTFKDQDVCYDSMIHDITCIINGANQRKQEINERKSLPI